MLCLVLSQVCIYTCAICVHVTFMQCMLLLMRYFVYLLALNFPLMSERRAVFCLLFQLEQMEIETRELPLKERDRYQTRLKSYHAELSKLEKDLVCL